MSKEHVEREVTPEFTVLLPAKGGAHVRVVPTGKPAAQGPPPRPRRNLAATLRLWHQRAGLAAFLFLGWLGLSGVLLNEASDLGLNSVRVGWSWLMAIYGL